MAEPLAVATHVISIFTLLARSGGDVVSSCCLLMPVVADYFQVTMRDLMHGPDLRPKTNDPCDVAFVQGMLQKATCWCMSMQPPECTGVPLGGQDDMSCGACQVPAEWSM